MEGFEDAGPEDSSDADTRRQGVLAAAEKLEKAGSKSSSKEAQEHMCLSRY